ncbi:MAG: carboxypeptidase regulatory-like domain-containing protein [Pyrinomonadaceae bacterium]
MRKFTHCLALLLLAFAATVAVQAQTTTGRIVGTVSTPDGAVVPGASVVLTDTKTGRERTFTTSEEGGFSIPNLDVGVYTVKVTAQGFKTTTATVTVQVGQEYSLPIQLAVGDVSETVTVTAGADIINSTNAELTSTLSNRQITELPLATRNPLALILTQAGSGSNPNQNTSINGSRTSATNITRDGVNIQDNFIRSNATDFAPGRPSVDNVEEFTLSSQSSLDTGFGAAQVNFVTPRGGNEFHGAGWIYNRNSAFGANSFFANASGSYPPDHPAVIAGFRRAGEPINPRPYRNRNQYGTKVSGPILKNKLFFFAFGEKLKDIVQSSRVVTTLTPTARQGIFRYSAGGTVYSVNIFTPGAFTVGSGGGTVPTGINTVVANEILSQLPAGNGFESGDGLNTQSARYFQQANSERESLTGRIDWDLNSKNNINFVGDYNYEENLRNDVDTFSVIPVVLQPARNVLFSGGWRFTPTANLNNEFRIGRIFSRPDFLRTDNLPGFTYAPTLVNFKPGATTAAGLNQGRSVSTVNAQDTLTWIVSDHTLRLGVQYQRVDISAYNDIGTLPHYNFGISSAGPVLNSGVLSTAAGGPALTATQQTTARNLFALLGGIIGSGQQTFNVTSRDSGFVNRATNLREFRYWMLAPYVTDQWRARPDLTVNVGLRFDYQAPLRSKNGLYWEPAIPSGKSVVDAVLDPAGTFQFIGGNSGKANTFYKADTNNWAPAIGVAWAPKNMSGFFKGLLGEDFVLRGGYRLSYVNDELVRAPDNALGNHPGFSSTIAALRGGTSTALDDRLGGTLTPVAVPTFVSSRSYTTNNTAAFSNTGTVFAIDPELKTPMQHDYSIGIQRKFGDWVFEARYVGSQSSNMLRTIDYNQVKIPAAYAADFAVVRANVLAGCATNAACATGAPLFQSMVNAGGVLATNTFGSLVSTGQIAELIWQQLINGNIPNPNTVPVPTGALRSLFLANPNAGVVNVLENGGSFHYNSGQFELRRQFSKGLFVQANYTFSKELTDAIGTAQTRVEPFLDNANRKLDVARADYDQTHVLNVNAIYELPFGKGRRWFNDNTLVDYVIGGWQLGFVGRLASGSPITFTDARGTLNRSGRSGRQTALTTLTGDELKRIVGVFRTPCGVYFVNPIFININQANLAAGNCTALTAGVPTGTVGGAASSGFGQPSFTGQVFFNNGPLQTSGLGRAIVNGPTYLSADISLLKNFRITERVTFQVRGEAYNFTNTPYFAPGQFIDINSTTFGRITGVAVGARVIQFAGRLSF